MTKAERQQLWRDMAMNRTLSRTNRRLAVELLQRSGAEVPAGCEDLVRPRRTRLKERHSDARIHSNALPDTTELTEKRRKFVEEYMMHGNATRAAIAAGYAESGARQEGHRLLTNADVRAAIRARIALDPRIMTREERQWMLTMMAQKLGDYENLSASEQQRAIELLGKTQGDFIDKSEIREDVHYHISWDEDDEPERPSGRRSMPERPQADRHAESRRRPAPP